MEPSVLRSARSRALPLALLPWLAAACNTFQGREGTQFDATVSYWRPEPHGDVEISAGDQPGTASKASLSNDLSLSDDDQWLGRLNVAMGKHRFGLEYLPIKLHDDGPVDIPFTFQGATYPTGDFVTTDLDLKTWALRWDFLLQSERKSQNALRGGLGVWYWSFDAQVKGANSGNNEERSFSHIYPGVQGNWVSEFGESFIATLDGAYALNSLDNRLFDLSFDVAYPVSDHGKLRVGYRYMTWDFEHGGDEGDFNLRGPYVGLSFSF